MAVPNPQAKGDLLVADVSLDWQRLPVGTNGQVLQADSGETLGVKWATLQSLSDWSHYVEITTQNAKVLEAVDVIAYDLNLLPASFWTRVRSDGADIRVADAAGNVLPFEVINFDQGASAGWVFFFPANLSTSIDTTYRIYYGNAAASALSPGSSSHLLFGSFASVYHFNTSPASALADATRNGLDLTAVNMEAGDLSSGGPFGKFLDLDGTNEYLERAHGWRHSFSGVGGFHISAWARWDGGVRRLLAKGSSSDTPASVARNYDVFISGSNIFLLCENTSTANFSAAGATALSSGTWYKFDLVFDPAQANELRAYVNGTLDGSGDFTGVLNENTQVFRVGTLSNEVASCWDGGIAEVRLRRGASSANAIKTIHDAEASPATFFSTGSEIANS